MVLVCVMNCESICKPTSKHFDSTTRRNVVDTQPSTSFSFCIGCLFDLSKGRLLWNFQSSLNG